VPRRLRFLLVVVAAFGFCTDVADASFATRLADVESPLCPPYDFDQVSVSSGTATRTSALAYTGTSALRLTYRGGGGFAYARGVLENNGTGFEEGDDVWVGAAVYLEPGYYANKGTYADILRLDSYVTDDGWLIPHALAQNVTLASFSTTELYVQAQARTGEARTLIGPLPSSTLPEGSWNWVELHVKASVTSGEAITDLRINGISQGLSTVANRFLGRRNWNRFRAGLVSAGRDAGEVALNIDRMSISPTELGPAAGMP
jgi:hypothetical protein